jgi:predicted ATPase
VAVGPGADRWQEALSARAGVHHAEAVRIDMPKCLPACRVLFKGIISRMIRRFYVHNFRCLENFELPILSHSTALIIGKNGSGKSTVARALEILQRIARGVNRVDELVKPKDLARGRADAPMRFEITAELNQQLYEYSIAFEFPEGFRALRVLDERLSVDGRPVFTRELAEVLPSKAGSRQNTSSFRVDWHVVALPIVQEQSSIDPIAVFKRWLARAIILRPIPSLISGKSSQQTFELDPSASNFAEWFTAITTEDPASYGQIDKYLRQIMPDLKAIRNPMTGTEARSMSVDFSNEVGTASILFEDLSDGEKCFIMCSLVLAANEIHGPLLCYWDEPDCYLAPDEVGHLVMALRRAFEVKGQLIVTSHDVEAVLRFSDENTIVFLRQGHLEPTNPRVLKTLQIDGSLAVAFVRGELEPS